MYIPGEMEIQTSKTYKMLSHRRKVDVIISHSMWEGEKEEFNLGGLPLCPKV